MKITYKTQLIILFIIFILFQILANHPLWRWNYANPTGDEPHYLVMIESLIYDFDINIINNYATIKFDWVPKDQMHLITGANGLTYPLHRWGLPIVLSLPYFLAGLSGVVLFLTVVMFIGALLIAEALKNNSICTDSSRPKIIFCILFLTPVVFFTGQIYPETVVFFLISLLLYFSTIKCTYKIIHAISLFVIVTSALMHEKLVVLVTPLIFVLFYRNKILDFILLSGASFIIYYLFIYNIYGFDFFSFMSGAGGSYLNIKNIPRNVVLLLVDQRYGILYTFPLLLLIPFSITRKGMLILLSCVPYLVVILLFKEAHAGFCPPGRYLFPIYPLIIYALSRNLVQKDNPLNLYLFTIAFVIGFGYLLAPSIVYPNPSIPNGYFHYIFNLNNNDWFVSLLPTFNTDLPPLEPQTRNMIIRGLLPLSLAIFVMYRNNSNYNVYGGRNEQSK